MIRASAIVVGVMLAVLPPGTAFAQTPVNDQPAGALPLPSARSTYTNIGSFPGTADFPCASTQGTLYYGADVWFTFTAPVNGRLSLTAELASTDAIDPVLGIIPPMPQAPPASPTRPAVTSGTTRLSRSPTMRWRRGRGTSST